MQKCIWNRYKNFKNPLKKICILLKNIDNISHIVCETQHIQKTVTESKPICTTTEMTMEVDGQLVTFPTKVKFCRFLFLEHLKWYDIIISKEF